MADFFFFTDADLTGKLIPQTLSDAFGAISDTEFRVTSLHSAISDPRAFAVCDGEIAVQQDADPNLLNIILKPKKQVTENGINFVTVKYFIYKGIKKTSLISGSTIAPISTNHVTEKTFLAQNDMNRKKEINEGLPVNSVTLTPSLSLLGYNIVQSDDTSLDKLFYKPNSALFQNLDISAGNYIGDFNQSQFGLEIVIDDVRSQGIFKLIRNVESKINSPVGLSNPSGALKRKNQKESIISFMDPCAFYGSMLQYGGSAFEIKYRFSSDIIDITTPANNSPVRKVSKEDIYDKLLVHFANKNVIYLDIRNELNQSLNFLENYTNDVNITIPNADDELITKDYYNNFGWPLLYLNQADFDLHGNNNDSSREKLILEVSLPNPGPENSDPFIYIAQGCTQHFESRRVLKGDKRYIKLANNAGYTEIFKISVPNYKTASVITPISQYIKIKYLKSTLSGSSSGIIPRATTYLDLLFVPYKMNLPFELSDNTKVRTFNEDAFIKINTGSQFTSSIGIAEDPQNITLFAFARHKLKTTGITKLPSCSITSEVSNESHFLNIVRDKFKKDKLVQGSLNLGSTNPIYLRFVDSSPLIPGNLTDGNLRDEFVAIVFPKTKFVTMFFDSSFSLEYDIYIRLQNIDSDASLDGIPYTTCDLILEGYNDNGTTISLGTYDPGIKLYSFDATKNLIFIDKDSLYDISTPFDTLPPCTGAFSQEELKYLQKFIDNEISTAGPPFGDIYPNVFNISGTISTGPVSYPITVSGTDPGPYVLHNPYTSSTPAIPLPKGFLAEASTIFALYLTGKQLDDDTKHSDSIAKKPDAQKSEIFRILKQVLIDSGFKKPDPADVEWIKDFNDMIDPNIHIGYPELPQFSGDNLAAKSRIYKNMIIGNRLGSSGAIRYVFSKGATFGTDDFLKGIDLILKQLGDAIKQWIDEKSKCVYKILSGFPIPPTNVFLASGDGSETKGLFNQSNNGVLLFNYDYDGFGRVMRSAKRKFTSVTSGSSTIVHLNMFGIEQEGNSSVIVTKNYTKFVFKANDAPGTGGTNGIIQPTNGINADEAKYNTVGKYFYKETSSIVEVLAYYDIDKKDLIFIDSGHFSFEIEQISNNNDLVNPLNPLEFEEFTTSINIVEGPKLRIFDFEAENLFSNDVFVLAPAEESTLLSAPRYTEPLNFLIERLISVPNIPISIVLNGNYIGKYLDPADRTTNSKVGRDETYQFYRTRAQGRQLENDTDNATLYPPLRYSYGSVSITEHSIIITIDSFVSPLWSRLDTKVSPSQKGILDNLTHYYTIPGSDAYVDRVGGDPNPTSPMHLELPSYNPILSALRSFGLVEALKNIVVDRATTLGTYTPSEINTMKAYFESKISIAKVLRNDTLGISGDITHTHFIDFQ